MSDMDKILDLWDELRNKIGRVEVSQPVRLSDAIIDMSETAMRFEQALKEASLRDLK